MEKIVEFILIVLLVLALLFLLGGLLYSQLRQLWIESFFIAFASNPDRLASELLQLEIAAAYARYFKLMAKVGKTSINSQVSMTSNMTSQQMNLTYESSVDED